MAIWQNIIDSLWFNFFFAVLLILAMGSGILYAIRYKKKSNWESSGIENSVVGIFGLIISFTFLQAGNAHRERFANIHKEAANIDMLYRYSKGMPDSFYKVTRNTLITFLDNQITYQQSDDEQFLYNAKKISDSYWLYLMNYTEQTNDLIHADRLNKISVCFDQIRTSVSLLAYSYYERTPSFVMFLLVIVALLIGFLVGFMNAIKLKIHYLLPTIYFVMITLTMAVISDLNNPRLGFIKPSYHHLGLIYENIKNN